MLFLYLQIKCFIEPLLLRPILLISWCSLDYKECFHLMTIHIEIYVVSHQGVMLMVKCDSVYIGNHSPEI